MKRCTPLLLWSALAILSTESSFAQVELPQPKSARFGTISVRLQSNGTLVGAVGHIDPNSLELSPIEGASISFVQNGQLMARTVSGAGGVITVHGLTAQAVYTVIARATFDERKWFLAHGVTVLAAKAEEASAALSRRPTYRLTSARAIDWSLEQMAEPALCLAMIPEGDQGYEGQDTSAPVLDEGIVDGGGMGGGGGEGVAAAGWAAAAVAAGVAVAASDDSGTATPLASPFRP